MGELTLFIATPFIAIILLVQAFIKLKKEKSFKWGFIAIISTLALLFYGLLFHSLMTGPACPSC